MEESSSNYLDIYPVSPTSRIHPQPIRNTSKTRRLGRRWWWSARRSPTPTRRWCWHWPDACEAPRSGSQLYLQYPPAWSGFDPERHEHYAPGHGRHSSFSSSSWMQRIGECPFATPICDHLPPGRLWRPPTLLSLPATQGYSDTKTLHFHVINQLTWQPTNDTTQETMNIDKLNISTADAAEKHWTSYKSIRWL